MSSIIIVSNKSVTKEIFLNLPKRTIYQMCKNKVKIELIGHLDDRSRIKLDRNIKQWCLENCSGLYRIYGDDCYFEKEQDVAGFKLAFEGEIKF